MINSLLRKTGRLSGGKERIFIKCGGLLSVADFQRQNEKCKSSVILSLYLAEFNIKIYERDIYFSFCLCYNKNQTSFLA